MDEITFSLDKIEAAASRFVESIGDTKIFLFEGDMGAGKTTFISEVCRQLGVKDDIGSPTFSLVNEYQDNNGDPIYHFDFYRIESPQEAMDIGTDDYFNSGHLCLIEWPDRLGPLIPDNARNVDIRENSDETRTLRF